MLTASVLSLKRSVFEILHPSARVTSDSETKCKEIDVARYPLQLDCTCLGKTLICSKNLACSKILAKYFAVMRKI